MYKVIILLLGLLVTSTLQSQESWFVCSSVSYQIVGESWTKPESTDIPIFMSTSKKRIEIYSKKTQIIDYVGFETTSTKAISFGSFATDSDYKKIYIVLYILNNVSYLEVQYSDVNIRYELSSP